VREVTIFMATFRRSVILRRTLEGYTALAAPAARWRLVLIDNADDPETRAVAEAFAGRFPLDFVVEPGGGKNRALNRTLARGSGELYVFTDDDAIPRPDWLVELVAGVERWPEATMYGGRIDPVWPAAGAVPRLSDERMGGAFTMTCWPMEEGPLTWARVWGPNMAIRPRVFHEGVRFNASVGPAGPDFVMGGEVDLTKRLAEAGHTAVFLPRAVVDHQVRPEQLTEPWLARRFYRLGCGVARLHGVPRAPRVFGVPRFVLGELLRGLATWAAGIVTHNDAKRLDGKLEFWHWRGKLKEYRRMSAQATVAAEGGQA
jgi:hypothetical protein